MFRTDRGRTATVVVATSGLSVLNQAAAPSVHKWVTADITEYVLTLKVRSGSAGAYTYVDLSPAVADVRLPTIGVDAKTTAIFANMRQGAYYRAFVVAWGQKDGGAPSASDSQLNSEAADDNVADFDFTATQDVAVAAPPRSVGRPPRRRRLLGQVFRSRAGQSRVARRPDRFGVRRAVPIGRAC